MSCEPWARHGRRLSRRFCPKADIRVQQMLCRRWLGLAFKSGYLRRVCRRLDDNDNRKTGHSRGRGRNPRPADGSRDCGRRRIRGAVGRHRGRSPLLLEARADVRLVFTDVQMPGSMDGLRLAHAVRHRWPPVELIVPSGRRPIGASDLPDRGRFIAKPYDFDALSQAFQEMVGADRRR
jgi:hypothetical protein